MFVLLIITVLCYMLPLTECSNILFFAHIDLLLMIHIENISLTRFHICYIHIKVRVFNFR